MIALLSGCGSGGPEARLSSYLERLARPLGQRTSSLASPTLVLAPRAEALRLIIEGDSLDGLDFLRLRGCALQTTVARRNSSLGRVAPPSQRLLLELAFLRDAPACIEKLRDEGKGPLAGLLAATMSSKQEQLPALIFNATLGNVEYREFWRENNRSSDYPARTSSLVVTALEQVAGDAQRWLSGDYRVNERSFELALSDIARGDGGSLRAALRLQTIALEQGNRMIERRLSEGNLCQGGLRPDAAPILRTVVQKYFVGTVQPWSASLNQRYHQLLPPLLALEALLKQDLPRDYLSWRMVREAEMQQALGAPARHVKRLQDLLGSCYREFAARGAVAP